jgi:hypothetical protein
MYGYLNNNHSGNAMGKDALALTDEHYLRPQSRAALCEPRRRCRGSRSSSMPSTARGGPGIGITWPVPKRSLASAQTDLVFDATRFAYLGVADGGAVLTFAIVYKVNQRP